jgi:hypothetical protein
MSKTFPADGSKKSLLWAIALALIIDIPFLFTTTFAFGTSNTLMFLMMILPIGISGLIIYASYTAGRMNYDIGEESLRINFPLSPLRLRYDQIKSATKVNTTLSFRLFGGSLPGAHWGRFTTSNFGSAQVYATRAKGEFVLLEVSDGMKVLLSPREPDAFIEAMKSRTALIAHTLAEVKPPSLDLRVAAVQVAVVGLAWIALVAYVASIYPGLPEVIPVHFGLDDVPNRWGSKVEILLLVGLAALFPVLNAVFVLKFGKYNRGLSAFLGVVFLLALGLFAFVVNQMVQAI